MKFIYDLRKIYQLPKNRQLKYWQKINRFYVLFPRHVIEKFMAAKIFAVLRWHNLITINIIVTYRIRTKSNPRQQKNNNRCRFPKNPHSRSQGHVYGTQPCTQVWQVLIPNHRAFTANRKKIINGLADFPEFWLGTIHQSSKPWQLHNLLLVAQSAKLENRKHSAIKWNPATGAVIHVHNGKWFRINFAPQQKFYSTGREKRTDGPFFHKKNIQIWRSRSQCLAPINFEFALQFWNNLNFTQ